MFVETCKFTKESTGKSQQSILYVFILFFSLLLSACGGGGGGSTSTPTGDQGSIDQNTGLVTPLAITTPYNGSVSDGSSSYYVIKNLPPSTTYTIHVHSLTGEANLYGYSSELFYASSCSSDRTGLLDEGCSMKSNADGHIFIKITSPGGSGGASFIIDLRSAVNEGSNIAPMELTASTLSYVGSVAPDGESFYVISGLTPGNVYSVSLNNVLYYPTLFVDMHNDYSGSDCYSMNSSWSDESCELAANFEGKLFLKVPDDSFSGSGAFYSINITDTGTTQRIFEGYSSENPLFLDSLPYNGQATYNASSYYRITGLPPGSRHEVHLTNYTPSTNMFGITPTSDPGGSTCNRYGYSNGPDMWCVLTATDAGNINLRVQGAPTDGSVFDLSLATAPVAEGSEASPVVISAATPYNGQVDGTYSYYLVTGLIPDHTYEITITDATRTTYVNTGIDFASMPAIRTSTARSNASGELYVLISSIGDDGSWFTLGVIEANNPEGTEAAPVSISSSSSSVPHAGQTDDRNSYYIASGLDPNSFYMVHVTDVQDRGSVDFTVYDDSTLTSSQTCNDLSLVEIDEDNHCLVAPTPAGELYIVADGRYVTGSSYNMWIAPSLIMSEGLPNAPIDITGLLDSGSATTYHGEVSSKYGYRSSFYMATLTTGPANYTIDMTGLSDLAGLKVTNAITGSTMYRFSNRPGLMDESCVITTQDLSGGVKSVDIVIEVFTPDITSYDWDGAEFDLTITPGGVPALSEGSIATPVDITGSMPYAGKVQSYGDSYYRVTGLNPSTHYEVRLWSDTDQVDMKAYLDSSFTGTTVCDTFDGSSTITIPHRYGCEAQPNASGELYLTIDGNTASNSQGNFELNVVPVPVAEGSLSAPVDLSGNLPRDSQVGDATLNYVDGGVNSYYMISGLTPGASYDVLLSNVTRYVDFVIATDLTFSNLGDCPWFTNICTATATETGEIYIHVDGYHSSTSSGAYFTIDVVRTPVSEGSVSSPIDISYRIAHRGSISTGEFIDSEISYYRITGLVPNSSHHIRLSNKTSSIGLNVYGAAGYQYSLCTVTDFSSDTGCAAAANDAGELYITVWARDPGNFDITVH